MTTPDYPFLRTEVVMGKSQLYARITPGVFSQLSATLQTSFSDAIKNSRHILPSSSQGKSGIKSLTGGGWEVKINSGERLFTSSDKTITENDCLLMVFDRFQRKHG
ncbi:MAG: hypothetical protein SFZ23_05045 [Planctomycetota bacterium]|nr:hypothetical protein [Planctomycetota bacterium]